MTPDRHMRVLALARDAMRLSPAERDAFVRSRCGGDEALESEVASAVSSIGSATIPGTASATTGGDDVPEVGELVEADVYGAPTIFGVASTSAELFESGTGALDAVSEDGTAVPGPERIGPYRILGTLGQGGMGIVYLAEQERPTRTVALKVVRPEMMAGSLLKRFELESQMLARLQHPGIAQVYEAGIARDGPGAAMPYFAMEYVRGAMLTEYADRGHLSVRDRLALMASICDAVQHAHLRGVIHRDLKPANILVTADGAPKILDFGIARATDSDIKATARTDVGQLVGTLPYMSPEQIAGDPAALDTRSDVYTLGVILYELLSGKLPFDLGRGTLFEAAHTITRTDAPRLATVNASLRGDISTIVAKAMEKDRERRYQTASEFAADIGRYLKSEPIAARPATTVYQLRKFAGRNRGLVAGACAAVVMLVMGVVGTSMGMARAIDQRERAEAEQRRADDEAKSAEAINDFLVDRMLAAATPEESQGRQITVSEVVGKAASEIDGAFADRPRIKARLYGAVGKSYTSLGEYDRAEKYMLGAVELRRAEGDGSAALGAALHELGSLRFRQTRWADAEALFRESAAVFAATGKNDRDAIESRASLAACLRNVGKLEEAQREQTLAIEQARERLGSEHAVTLAAMTNLAIVLHDTGRVKDAEKLYREVAETRKRVLGMNHPSTLLSLGNLSTALYDLGDIEGAERAQSESLEVRKKVSGIDHPETLLDMSNLAVMREKLGRITEAERLYREALELGVKRLGEENESVAILMSNLASNLATQGKNDEAEAIYLRSTAILMKVNGSDHAETIQNELGYARWLVRVDRLADAEPILVRIQGAASSKFGDDNPIAVATTAALASLLEKQGRFAEALPLAEKALAGRRKLLGDEHPAVKDATDLVERIRAQAR